MRVSNWRGKKKKKKKSGMENEVEVSGMIRLMRKGRWVTREGEEQQGRKNRKKR